MTSDPQIVPEPRTPHEEVTQVDSYLLDVRHVGRVFVVGTILILHLHSNDGPSVLVLGKERTIRAECAVGTVLANVTTLIANYSKTTH